MKKIHAIQGTVRKYEVRGRSEGPGEWLQTARRYVDLWMDETVLVRRTRGLHRVDR